MTGDGRAFPDPRAFYEHIGRQDVLAEFDKAAQARSEWERKYLPFNIVRFSGYGLIGLGVTAFFLLGTPGTLIGVVGLLAGLAGGGVLGAALAAALAVVAPIAAAGVAGGVALAIIGLSVGVSCAAVGAALLLVHYLLAPREIPRGAMARRRAHARGGTRVQPQEAGGPGPAAVGPGRPARRALNVHHAHCSVMKSFMTKSMLSEL